MARQENAAGWFGRITVHGFGAGRMIVRDGRSQHRPPADGDLRLLDDGCASTGMPLLANATILTRAKHHTTVTMQYVNPRLTATARLPMPASIRLLTKEPLANPR